MIKKLSNWVKDNIALVVAGVVIIALSLWCVSCQPTTKSLLTKGDYVTRQELDGEVELLSAQIESRYGDLARRENIRAALLNAALKVAKGEQVDPIGLLTTLGGIAGSGIVVNNATRKLRNYRNGKKQKNGSDNGAINNA